MTRRFVVALGALLGGCVTVAAAQATPVSAVDWFGILGVGSGGGALIAWGVQTERVKSHSRRIEKLENDRVTRDEFREMREDIRNILVVVERRNRPRDA